jgi:predicted DNA-binding transcriptional regulator
MTKSKINPKILKLLSNLGLNEREIAVYLAGIQLGPTTIAKLSQHSNLGRTTVYPVIETLTKKGLMTEMYSGWKKCYSAESPSKLRLILEQKKSELDELLPELDELTLNQDDQSLIKIQNGKTQIKKTYYDLLETKDPKDYLVIANRELWESNMGESFTGDFYNKRSKVGFDIKLIYTDSKIARFDKKNQYNYSHKIKILDSSVFFDSNIIITEDTILIHHLRGENNLIRIKNVGFIRTLKEMFGIMWNLLD